MKNSNETFIMHMTITDFEGKTKYSKEISGDAPNIYDFANFCYYAGRAYGFTEQSLDKVIQQNFLNNI